jgi:hypothetical protein
MSKLAAGGGWRMAWAATAWRDFFPDAPVTFRKKIRIILLAPKNSDR